MVTGKPGCFLSNIVQTKNTLFMDVTLLPHQLMIIPQAILNLCVNIAEIGALHIGEYDMDYIR